MNVAWTRAAEGYPRRAFTVADVRNRNDLPFDQLEFLVLAQHAGINHPPPSYDPHERAKSALILAVTRWLPDDLWFGVESSIYLAERTFVEPDICVFRKDLKSHNLKGSDLLLVIEVSDSSLTFDRGIKALLYAGHGVRELWVMDVATRITSVHTGPTGVGWTSVREVLPYQPLRAGALPDFQIRMADLETSD